MLKYIAKRLAVGAFTLFLLATVTFFLMHVIPGSPFAGETSKLPAKVKERLYEKYGLDKPVSEQYVMYLKNAAKGDFGVSIYRKGKSIDKIIKNGLPYTMRLGAVSITFALVTGIFLGTVAAFTKKNGWRTWYWSSPRRESACPASYCRCCCSFCSAWCSSGFPLWDWTVPSTISFRPWVCPLPPSP